MKKIIKLPYLSLVFLVIALVIIVHQYFFYRKVFEISDLHHETFFLIFLFMGIISIYVLNKRLKVLKLRVKT